MTSPGPGDQFEAVIAVSCDECTLEKVFQFINTTYTPLSVYSCLNISDINSKHPLLPKWRNYEENCKPGVCSIQT
jgi:hypothetical protein